MKMVLGGGAVLLLLGAAISTTGPAPVQDRPPAELRIPLRIDEPAGLDRRAEPVTTGIPLPMDPGVRDPGRLQLLRDGVPVPAQIRPLSRWHGPVDDASRPLRWVTVHFQADVAAGGSATYELVTGRPAGGEPPALATRDGGDVVVDTGPLAFRVGSEALRIVEDVRIDLDGDSVVDAPLVGAGHDGGIEVVRPDGTLYRSSADGPVEVTLEENGPLHAVVRVRGRHRPGTAPDTPLADGGEPLEHLDFVLRIHAYRGHSWVRALYSVSYPERARTNELNRGGARLAHELESLSVALPVRTLGDPLTVTMGGEAPTPLQFPDKEADPAAGTARISERLASTSTATLYQDSSGGPRWQDSADGAWGTSFRGYRTRLGDRQLDGGLQAAGWMDISAPAWGVTVGMRHFWQNFPKGLRADGDGLLRIDLWPPGWRVAHRLEGGRRKTHELFLHFHRRALAPGDLAFESFRDPLRALAPSRWYRDTLALGPLPVRDGGIEQDLQNAAAAAVIAPDGIWRERRERDMFGWRNWGDSYRDGDKNDRTWGNNEFDFAWPLLAHWITEPRTDRRFVDVAESMVRHLMDIDVYHTDRDARAYSHGIRQHDAGDTTDHSRPPILSHAWIRGLLTWHVLTGDRLALDTAREVGGWIDGLVDDRDGTLLYHGQSRSQAWAALAVTELWEVTGERRWLDMAGRLLAAEVIADQGSAAGGRPCPDLDWEGNAGERDRPNASPWQNGYVAEALGRYAFDRRLAGSPDAAAETALFRLLDALQSCGFATPTNGLFVPGDPDRDQEVYGRRYHSLVLDRLYPDGSYRITVPNNHLLSDGYAYGALLTTDAARRERYLDMGRETWRWTMGPESAPGVPFGEVSYCCPATPAKNAAMKLRFGHAWLWLQQRLQSRDATGG